MSDKIILSNDELGVVFDINIWNSIVKFSCLAFSNYIHIFYKINIIDAETGTITHYNLSNLKKLIDELSLFNQSNFHIFNFYSILNNYKDCLTALDLKHIFSLFEIQFINNYSYFNIDSQHINNTFILFKYIFPFFTDKNNIHDFENIYRIFENSLQTNTSILVSCS